MNTYKFEQSLCDALNLPQEYFKSDQDYLIEHESWLASRDKVPSLFEGMRHTNESKRLMSETLSDGRRKKPKTTAWKASRSNTMKGKLLPWIPRKRVLYNGVEYPSIKEAAAINGVNRRIIKKYATTIHESSLELSQASLGTSLYD